jgi:cell division protein FtsL
MEKIVLGIFVALFMAVSMSAQEPSQVQLKARILQLEAVLNQKNLESAACQVQLSNLTRPAEQKKIEQESGCKNGFDWTKLECKAD